MVGLAALFWAWTEFFYEPWSWSPLSPPEARAVIVGLPVASTAPRPPVLTAATSIPTAAPTATLEPTPRPTPAVNLLAPPSSLTLGPMAHDWQKLNNCGPVSLAIAASYYQVNITQFDAAAVVKGGELDRNVSPDEMVAYLKSIGLDGVERVNGNREMMIELLANNIPVIVHQWLVRPGDGELVGHYRVLKGYDQNQGLFITQDPFRGPDVTFTWEEFEARWRPFDHGYIPVYRPEQAHLVAAILGPDWDTQAMYERALADALADAQTTSDGYGWFNTANAYYALGRFEEAAQAYDRAFTYDFPELFLWYQFSPLYTYLEVGQYERVLELTVEVLANAGELEEARYARGLAYQGLEDLEAARAEFEKAVAANPRFRRAAEALAALNGTT
ncbi:MAG: C39 family peptidase [Anaerolineae bacterium]